MKRTLVSILCVLAIISAQGQKRTITEGIEGTSPINIGLNQVNKTFIAPSQGLLKSASQKKSDFIVTYVGFPEEAKAAFEYAVELWESQISSTVPISVLAKWESFSVNALALSRASMFYKNFDNAMVPDVYYPIALVERLSGQEWNGTKEADIICSFNSNSSWYYGTDGNTDRNQYDLVTAALHEIAHGLGISGFLSAENGEGTVANTADAPSIFDYLILNTQNQRITDPEIFSRPSTALYEQLTSNGLQVGTDKNKVVNGTSIHAPSTWKTGVSLYHLSNSSSVNELMSPYLSKGEANHKLEGSTAQVINAMGWNSASVLFADFSDTEKTGEKISVTSKLNTTAQIDMNSIRVIYSKDRFATSDTTSLKLNSLTQELEAQLNVNNYKGKIYYYFTAETRSGEKYTLPIQAPQDYNTFKIGTDYYAPSLEHNPTNLISRENPVLDLSAIASDNIGIKEILVEYRINGQEMEPITLDAQSENYYSGALKISDELKKNDRLEYRLLAIDNSERGNKKALPSKGFYQVEIFESHQALTSFSTDFESFDSDFTTNDFVVSTPMGFNNSLMHTNHPYNLSGRTDEKYDLIAQLNHPIILEENGTMTFDEIVLVEPGERGTTFEDESFWDFVIVEASKDNGKVWFPLVEGYDCQVNDVWQSTFTSTLKSSSSTANGSEDLFWEQSVNLTDNPYFNAGDTILIRFRLSSDNSITGWGWAIDNLQIQTIQTTAEEEMIVKPEVQFYPNPCQSNLFISCDGLNEEGAVEIYITDLRGTLVHRETKYDWTFNKRVEVDLSTVASGIYLASISDIKSNTHTHKIIKN